MEISDRDKKRHLRFWHTMWWPVHAFARVYCKFKAEINYQPEGACLILCNHSTPYDPILLAAAFKPHMYYVASEHVLRGGLGAWFLKRYFSLIAKRKGMTDAATASQLLRALRRGERVMLFPEGNTCWAGRTAKLHPSMAKLVRVCGVPVVTYRLSGGFFTRPRWNNHISRGGMTGRIVNIYSPEQLRCLSDADALKLIDADLYEDAYAPIGETPVLYRGKRRAEGMEASLFICPRCGGIETLRGVGNMLVCSCGLKFGYDSTGVFDKNAPFSTITEWDDWQALRIAETAASCGEKPILSDAGQTLWQNRSGELVQIDSGVMKLYRDKLLIGETGFSIADITEISVCGRDYLVFSAHGESFEITSDHHRSGRKYCLFIDQLKIGG